MISLEKLLDIVYTEAIEFGGVQEVPERVDGTEEHYHSAKRGARSIQDQGENGLTQSQRSVRFDLELIEAEDGTLRWVEDRDADGTCNSSPAT